MTILLGASTFNQQGDTLQIESPLGFNTVNGLRIANYTVDVIILQNITGNDPNDQQYLPPFTQMVYPITDTQAFPTFTGLQLGADIPQEQVLIEWSTDADNDFLGTYPYSLPIVPSQTDGDAFYGLNVNVSNTGDPVPLTPTEGVGTYIVEQTLTNTGTNPLHYGTNITSIEAGNYAILPAGATVTIRNGAVIWGITTGGSSIISTTGTYAT